MEHSTIRKALGVKDPGFKARLISNLLEYGTLDNARRAGCPPKYTKEHLVGARELLSGVQSYYYRPAQLKAELIERGHLPKTPRRLDSCVLFGTACLGWA